MSDKIQQIVRGVDKREIWVDNIKVIACILVVLGHFYQSMVKSEILLDTAMYRCFNQTVYFVHIPLFFIASGYLYQKNSKVNSLTAWKMNAYKKAIALLIPYFLFSTLTWVIKMMFSSAVNDVPPGLLITLFQQPLSPYWYLYILFFLFLVTFTFQDKTGAVIGIFVALLLKVITLVGLGEGKELPYLVDKVFESEIGFVLGMSLSVFKFHGKINTKSKKYLGNSMIATLMFLIASVLVYAQGIAFDGMSFVFGLFGCASIVVLICALFSANQQVKAFDFLARYTMPIFLMHTIFAATLRSILLKMGVDSAIIHVTLGVLISFVGPILATEIMKKTKILEFFIYPLKVIKVK